MRKIIKNLILLILFTTNLFSQSKNIKLEKTTIFFSEQEEINLDNIDCYYLSVPENWENPSGKKIKIAVTVLKSNSKKDNLNPVLFIQGGPGAGGIEGIWSWVRHPLREKSDIVLVDVRGTGKSLPKFCPDLGKFSSP